MNILFNFVRPGLYQVGSSTITYHILLHLVMIFFFFTLAFLVRRVTIPCCEFATELLSK